MDELVISDSVSAVEGMVDAGTSVAVEVVIVASVPVVIPAQASLEGCRRRLLVFLG